MLLRRYIEHKEETELPCLYAVQTFIHKLEHPQGEAENNFFLNKISLIQNQSRYFKIFFSQI